MAYIDDLFGPKHRVEKRKIVASIFNKIKDWEIAEDAVSDEILYQLERYLQGKSLTTPEGISEGESEYKYHKYCIYNNAFRNAYKRIKSLKDKFGFPVVSEILESYEDIKVQTNEHNKYENKQAWEVLIEGKKLLREFENHNIKHPARGYYKDLDIEIWADKERFLFEYEDIQEKYNVSYESARQIVSKVNWGIRELLIAKSQAGENGMFLITIKNNSNKNQIIYLLKKYEEEILFFESILQKLSLISDEYLDSKTKCENIIKEIEKYKNNSSVFGKKLTDMFISAFYSLAHKQHLSEDELSTIINKVEEILKSKK